MLLYVLFALTGITIVGFGSRYKNVMPTLLRMARLPQTPLPTQPPQQQPIDLADKNSAQYDTVLSWLNDQQCNANNESNDQQQWQQTIDEYLEQLQNPESGIYKFRSVVQPWLDNQDKQRTTLLRQQEQELKVQKWEHDKKQLAQIHQENREEFENDHNKRLLRFLKHIDDLNNNKGH